MTLFKLFSAQATAVFTGLVAASAIGMVVGSAGYPIVALILQIVICVWCYTKIPAWILKEELEALKSEQSEDQ